MNLPETDSGGRRTPRSQRAPPRLRRCSREWTARWWSRWNCRSLPGRTVPRSLPRALGTLPGVEKSSDRTSFPAHAVTPGQRGSRVTRSQCPLLRSRRLPVGRTCPSRSRKRNTSASSMQPKIYICSKTRVSIWCAHDGPAKPLSGRARLCVRSGGRAGGEVRFRRAPTPSRARGRSAGEPATAWAGRRRNSGLPS